MVFPLGVSLELRTVKVDVTQITSAVPPGFIVEMRGRRITAFASSGHSSCTNLLAELDYCDETVPARPIPLFRSWMGSRTKGRQRSPHRRSETNRDAWARIVKRLHNVSRQTLESIDVAPRGFPTPKIRRKFVRRIRKGLQQQIRRRFCTNVVAHVDARFSGIGPDTLLYVFAPENR